MDLPGFSLDLGSLKQAREPEPDQTYDLLILGGGPASMSAAVYAARKMLSLAIITRDFGGQVLETSEIENWLGYQNINAKEMVSQFEEHVKSFDLPVAVNAEITRVFREDGVFKVETKKGRTYQGKTVLISTGKRHRPLDIPGEKEFSGKGVAFCATCDAPFYKKKKVVVVGGGNSAFTAAVDLIKVEAQITMVNFVKGWSADKALQERVGKSGRAELLDYHEAVEIRGGDKVEAAVVRDRKSGKERTIEADGVFVEIGLISNTGPVKDLVLLNKEGEIEVDCSCRTSREGVFAAGDVTTVPYKQIIIAAGEGAKAALAAYDYLVSRGLA